MKKIKQYSYSNSEYFKFDNTRVNIISLKNDNYIIEFKILTDDTSPRAIHIVKKNKIVTTVIKITKESALSIIIGLQELLKKDCII